MKNLRIALVAPQPFVDIRGTSVANLRLTQALADAGHVVDVITYPFGGDLEYPQVNVHRCRRVPFVRSVRIGFSGAKVLLDLNLASRALRLIRNHRFDCIHGVEEGAFIGGLLARRARVPFVYDMDSVMSHEIANSKIGRFPPAVWLVRAAERWAIREAALVVTISESMAEYVRQVDPSQKAVVVPDVPIALPPGGSDPARARAQMPPEFSADRKLIVYTGSFAPYQGLDMLISAMARVVASLPEAVLVIVGGDEKGVRRLTKLAERVGVVRSVLLMGKKPPDEIPDLLSAADVLVSPRRAGLNPPAKIYTYMQSGRPIVATDIPAHTTILGADAAVLVEPTPAGIADGIIWIFAHTEKAERRAARAREVVGEFTPELQARRVREAYELVRAKIEEGGGRARCAARSERICRE